MSIDGDRPERWPVVDSAFNEHAAVVARCGSVIVDSVGRAAAAVADALETGGKVLTCGNGGSAADAQHLASELVGRYGDDQTARRAIALTADSSIVTAIANDFGFDRVFERQIDALADTGDVLVAISTSGRSTNVIAAARAARRAGCVVVAMTGAGGGDLATECDVHVSVPSSDVARVQELHGLCIHALVEHIAHAIEKAP